MTGNLTCTGEAKPPFDSGQLGLTDAGLFYSGGALLVRMRKDADGEPNLAIGADLDRMLAMLSVGHGRPIVASEVLPQVEKASDLWRRGEKALANLRLTFAKLAGPCDPAASHRVALAACLLDHGWPPAALVEELGLARPPPDLEKYNPYHVPSGHGHRSGQFDFRPGTIVVAGKDNDEDFEVREFLGETTPKEEVQHGHPIPIDPPAPAVGGRGFGSTAQSAVSAAARSAAANVGSGRGHVYGTKVHTEFNRQVKGTGRDDLHGEQSYMNRERVRYGTPGSVRVDAVEGSRDRPDRAYDLKTGGASLTRSRVNQLQTHLPLRGDGTEVPVQEVRP